MQHCTPLWAIKSMMRVQGSGAAGTQMSAAHLTLSMISMLLCCYQACRPAWALAVPSGQCICW